VVDDVNHGIMTNNVSKIPAYLVLRLISLLLVVIGLIFLSIVGASIFSATPTLGQHRIALLTTGTVLLFIGIVGPARVIVNGVRIPLEVRRSIFVQALVLPILGVVFIFSGIVIAPASMAWAYFVAGLLILVSAVAGFYALSRKLPRTFYIGEMVNVIKSAGITGDKKNSAADREFMRWTEGVREGVQVGAPAPNGIVTTMEGETVPLSSFYGENFSSPLVLNFCSYTCPHYRKRIDELHSLMEKWQDRGVRFLTVYTAEAHPEDGWKIAHQYDSDVEYTNEDDFCFNYARTIDDRKKMARWLIEKKHFKMPVVLDSIENGLLTAYNSWPIRLYIVNNGKVLYCGEQGPFGYDPARVDKTLRNLLN